MWNWKITTKYWSNEGLKCPKSIFLRSCRLWKWCHCYCFLYKNQVRLFSKIDKKGYSLLKCFSMNFTSVFENYSCCCSNRHRQILFFPVKRCEIIVFDLFDTSDSAVLPYGVDEGSLNESGEEIYVLYHQRTLIYLYNSKLKSLFYNLHWYLQKSILKLNSAIWTCLDNFTNIWILFHFFSETNTIQ